MSAAETRPLFDPRLEHMFKLRTQFMRALERAGGTHSIQQIADRVLDGTFQFWMRPQSAIVTEIIAYPLKRVVNYFVVVGDLDECLGMQDEIEAFARAESCAAVTCAGRAGWERILPRSGWQKMWSVMAKDLT